MSKKENFANTFKTVAIIPAGGSGIRMGGDQAKQFMELDDRPLLAVTLKPFHDCRKVDAIVLVVPLRDVDYCWKEIVERFELEKVKKVVPGGKRRQDSVRLGIEAAGENYGLVLIHDGVRPAVDEALIERVIEKARTHRAVITALPAKETVKEINSRGEVVKTYARQQVWLVQTPQVFRYEDIVAAHQKALHEEWGEATDDSVLIERLGIPVTVVEGCEKNIKITTRYDLELARFLLGH
ncbi:MAG: 2-C-methyl-D-erythritol 4-phosphate cytidylyltransferase [Desulfobacteraceae bacterium]|nr:MAG: 2-C-methyl-D-erythritol 4-phosphate cytidylyltransferase [Desulfobacteraceae bacterium]